MEYIGHAGTSKDCCDAIVRLVQCGVTIAQARILTFSNEHCFLLTVNEGDLVAVKSGFSSGYGGEGPRTFSYVLLMLYSLGIEIQEYEVSKKIIQRVDNASLSDADIEMIDKARAVRPSRWSDYVAKHHWEQKEKGTLWRDFPVLIPYGMVDSRIIDLALTFWQEPDQKLLSAYRRFEDVLRERLEIEDHGYDLIKEAFAPGKGRLTWDEADGSGRSGRFQLLAGTFLAYRNRRAHREESKGAKELADEFLLLNHLFHLERTAVPASVDMEPDRP